MKYVAINDFNPNANPHSIHFHLPHAAGSAKQYSITFFESILEEIFSGDSR